MADRKRQKFNFMPNTLFSLTAVSLTQHKKNFSLLMELFCRAWQDCSICKIVKVELDPLLAAHNTNEQLI